MRISVSHDTRWVVGADTSRLVLRALDDLARDWRRIFSTSPQISPKAAGRGTILAFGEDAVAELTGTRRDFAPEEHEVVVRRGRGAAAGQAVICADGGGPRGLIYAIYAVSEHILGVDPFWFWTDQTLPPTQCIDLDRGFAVRRDAPRFRWRGWYLNDEELLNSWAPSRSAAHGISLDAWDAVFETLLRLGGNYVVPGNFVFPDEPQLVLAAERGLAVGQHHGAPLGFSTHRWPEDITQSWNRHPQLLIDAWRDGIDAFVDREVVWSVGLRGRQDRGFVGDVGRDAASRGSFIRSIVDQQVALVRRVRPGDDIVLHLWPECRQLMEEGHFTMPDGVVAVSSDDGQGRLRELSPGGGIYYHVALSAEIGSQLTEMIHPVLVGEQLRRAAELGSTEQMLINVPDVRNHAVGAYLAMRLAWDADADLDREWVGWARRHVGEVEASQLQRLWRRYFDTLWYSRNGQPDRPRDMGYHRLARWILHAAAESSLEADFPVFRPILDTYHPGAGNRSWRCFIERAARAAAAVQPRLDELAAEVAAVLERVTGPRRTFVRDHLVTHVALHTASNRMLGCVARAVLEADGSGVRSQLLVARQQILETLHVLHRAGRGRCQDWYRGEKFVRAQDTIDLIDVYLDGHGAYRGEGAASFSGAVAQGHSSPSR